MFWLRGEVTIEFEWVVAGRLYLLTREQLWWSNERGQHKYGSGSDPIELA